MAISQNTSYLQAYVSLTGVLVIYGYPFIIIIIILLYYTIDNNHSFKKDNNQEHFDN